MAAVVTPAEREAAWWALYDALPAGWRIGELTFDPASERYELAAMAPRPHGRGKPPERVVVGRVSTIWRPCGR